MLQNFQYDDESDSSAADSLDYAYQQSCEQQNYQYSQQQEQHRNQYGNFSNQKKIQQQSSDGPVNQKYFMQSDENSDEEEDNHDFQFEQPLYQFRLEKGTNEKPLEKVQQEEEYGDKAIYFGSANHKEIKGGDSEKRFDLNEEQNFDSHRLRLIETANQADTQLANEELQNFVQKDLSNQQQEEDVIQSMYAKQKARKRQQQLKQIKIKQKQRKNVEKVMGSNALSSKQTNPSTKSYNHISETLKTTKMFGQTKLTKVMIKSKSTNNVQSKVQRKPHESSKESKKLRAMKNHKKGKADHLKQLSTKQLTRSHKTTRSSRDLFICRPAELKYNANILQKSPRSSVNAADILKNKYKQSYSTSIKHAKDIFSIKSNSISRNEIVNNSAKLPYRFSMAQS